MEQTREKNGDKIEKKNEVSDGRKNYIETIDTKKSNHKTIC